MKLFPTMISCGYFSRGYEYHYNTLCINVSAIFPYIGSTLKCFSYICVTGENSSHSGSLKCAEVLLMVRFAAKRRHRTFFHLEC